jgi:predicted transposase YdaD
VNTAVNTAVKDNSVEIARNLKAQGIDTATIAKATGLSAEEIEKL